MKIGLSTYCFFPLLSTNQMEILDVLQWIHDQGGKLVEIVPQGFTLDNNMQLVDDIRDKAHALGLELANYSVSGNFLVETSEQFEESIRKMKQQVDIAARLGVKRMRHDVVDWGYKNPAILQFDTDLPKLVQACRQVADYAAQFGITTSIENHGFYVTMSERVLRLVQTVDRPNFKVTLDIGNFLCVDEDPASAVKRCLPYASIVHLKDFYIRPSVYNPGEGWLETLSGKFLRGSIFGQGDVAVREILGYIKQSGYDLDMVIEFEGFENSLLGSKRSLDNVNRIWDEV
ncbi:MAG: sugar phosphate isomerase [Bacilli bacterium]|nr:sugar phosphate isomerase [Bacilli bacterium]